MRRAVFLLLVLVAWGLVGCARDKSPLGPVEQPGICPQHPIPWPSLANSPWPMFRHDPQLSGRSPYVGPRKGRIKWTFKPGGTVYSALVLGEDGTIYFTFCYGGAGNRSGLYALSPTGEVKWKLLLVLDSEVQPLVGADGTVSLVAHTSLQEGGRVLFAVGPEGVVRGQVAVPCELSTLLNIGLAGTLYCAMHGELSAFTQRGQLLWKVAPAEPAVAFGFQVVPISADGSTLYVLEHRSGGEVTALSAIGVDGARRWSFGLERGQRSNFCVVDRNGNICFGTTVMSREGESALYCLGPTGELRWVYPGNFSDILMHPAGNYFAYGNGLLCLDSEGRLQWRVPFDGNLSWFVSDCEGVVYSWSSSGVDAFSSTGELLWHVPYGVGGNTTRVSCPAIGADGTMYVGTYTNYPYTESCVVAIE